MTTDYENIDYLDRVTEAIIEYQVCAHARAYRMARLDEVLSHLSEHGLGDEADTGRITRAANRLVNEGVLVDKGGSYALSERGESKTEQAANMLEKLAFPPSDEETVEQPL